MARIGVTLRAASLDLQHLSLELLSNQAPSLPPDHSLASDALKREAEKLAQSGELSPEALAAVQATTQRIGDALGHIRRLEQALSDDEVASAAIGDVDLAAFWTPPILRPETADRPSHAELAGAFALPRGSRWR